MKFWITFEQMLSRVEADGWIIAPRVAPYAFTSGNSSQQVM